MQDRRAFLRASALMAGVGLAGRVQPFVRAESSGTAWSKTARLPRVEGVLNPEGLKPRGQFYQVTVPDTLDLATRAALSVDVLTHNVDQRSGTTYGNRLSLSLVLLAEPSESCE
jgi:hypothetical protein